LNALENLRNLGQSVWYDNVSRQLVKSGTLAGLVARGVSGVTSNPSIFERAIAHSSDYDEDIAKLSNRGAAAIFQTLAVQDIQDACDILRPVYDAENGRDGFVSIEVSPALANDAIATAEDARVLWRKINRPNLLIKIPGTRAGVHALRTLIAEGINVNVTLLFSQGMHVEVANAYLEGLEARPRNSDLSRLASVASFFVSRIDARIDGIVAEKAGSANAQDRAALLELRGKTAIANAKLAYEQYERIFRGERWHKLAARGARPQRLLWASTGTKEKSYSDVLYVDELIGPGTINTMPPETLEAYCDHGNPALRLQTDVAQAHAHLRGLASRGISLDAVTSELLVDGIKRFETAANQLFAAIEAKKRAAVRA